MVQPPLGELRGPAGDDGPVALHQRNRCDRTLRQVQVLRVVVHVDRDDGLVVDDLHEALPDDALDYGGGRFQGKGGLRNVDVRVAGQGCQVGDGGQHVGDDVGGQDHDELLAVLGLVVLGVGAQPVHEVRAGQGVAGDRPGPQVLPGGRVGDPVAGRRLDHLAVAEASHPDRQVGDVLRDAAAVGVEVRLDGDVLAREQVHQILRMCRNA